MILISCERFRDWKGFDPGWCTRACRIRWRRVGVGRAACSASWWKAHPWRTSCGRWKRRAVPHRESVRPAAR